MKRTAAVILIMALGLFVPGQAKEKSKPVPEKKKQECKAKDLVCTYIVATRKLLADYQTAIRTQIDDDQKSYTLTAQAAEQGKHDEVDSSLRFERAHRSETLTDDFIHGAKPIWHWKDYLLDYTAQDFQANREFLELESTDGVRFLSGIQGLEVEFSKVQALDKLLASLNDKQSLIDQLKELGSYAEQTKTEFDALVCAGLKKDIAGKTEAAKSVAAQSVQGKALNDAIKKLTAERTAKSCKD
jgi:hypothetical protein